MIYWHIWTFNKNNFELREKNFYHLLKCIALFHIYKTFSRYVHFDLQALFCKNTAHPDLQNSLNTITCSEIARNLTNFLETK